MELKGRREYSKYDVVGYCQRALNRQKFKALPR